jgi:dihydroneopterin aldolase
MLIENFEAFVKLGCLKEEQAFMQPVHISVRIAFSNVIPAEQSDRLEDAVNYVSICEKLNSTATQKKYHMIEHLSFECLKAVLPLLVNFSGEIQVTVKKIRVPVAQLQGGVSWTCQTPF